MKLLVDCHVFDGKFQGTRTYIQGLYTSMIKFANIDFYFAAQNVENLKACFGEKSNVHYVKLKYGSSIKRLVLEYPRLIKEYAIDYAHFQYIGPFNKCCKEIITVHDVLFLDYPRYFPFLYRIKNKLLFRRSAKRADLLLTVSGYSRTAISKHFSIDEKLIHVTPNAVLRDGLVCAKPSVCEKNGLDKFILSVGRVEPRKNFLSLLKAYVELSLNKDGYKLVFVGVPDLQDKPFNRYFASLPQSVKENVLFLKVPFADLVELYKKTSLFVFPSYAEGFGIPPLEAIEYGAPTLCSKETAMAEFDLPQEMLFSPYDMDELKCKMRSMLKNPLNVNVQDKIRARFNWDKTARQLYLFLEKAV